MLGLEIFAGIVVVGFAVARLRARRNRRPQVTSLMSRPQ